MATRDFVGSNTVFTLVKDKSAANVDKLLRCTDFGTDGTPDWSSIVAQPGTGGIAAGEEFQDFVIDPFCEAATGSGRAIGIYLLTKTKLYYAANVEATPTSQITWTQSAALPSGSLNLLVSALPSKAGGVVVYGHNRIVQAKSTFTLSARPEPLVYNPPPFVDNSFSTVTGHLYRIECQGAVGFTDSNRPPILYADAQWDQWYVHPNWVRRNHLEINGVALDAEDPTFDSMNHKYSFWVEGTGDFFSYRFYDEAGQYADNSLSFTISIYEVQTSSNAVVSYLENYGSTLISSRTFGSGSSNDIGLDVDDFGSGIIRAAGLDGQVYEANLYSGSFSVIPNSGVNNQKITGIRLWHQRLGNELSSAKNNQASQLHGLVSFANPSRTASKVERTGDDFVTTTEFTPISSSFRHAATGPNAYENLASDPRSAMFVGYREGELNNTNPILYRRIFKVDIKDDGTTVYTPRDATNNFNMVTFGPFGGTKDVLYACGPSGVGFSKDGGQTFIIKKAVLSTEIYLNYLKVLPIPEGPLACSDPNNHKRQECWFGSSACDAATLRPIELRSGTKILHETDLTVQTPAGALAFTRSYLQDEQQTFDFMGLGWTHNHAYKLTVSGTTAEVRLGNGGLLKLTQTSSGHFVGNAGSAATLDLTSAQEYTLKAHDESTYIFEPDPDVILNNWRLKSRGWSTGEIWNYYYDGINLDYVDDGYGRRLKFSYRSGADFKNGKLWRVGDHTSDYLDTTSPVGRYVEFDYLPNKIKPNGVVVNGSTGLLSSVRDVRGQTWGYDYYGQDGGETTETLLNYLTEVRSPSVDTTGNGTPDGSLILQRLTYGLGMNLAVNGNMELDSGWTSILGAAPSVNQRSSTQKHSGTYSRRVVANAGQGIEGASLSTTPGRVYVVVAWLYLPSNRNVRLKVAGTDVDEVFSGATQPNTWVPIVHSFIAPPLIGTEHRVQFLAANDGLEFFVDDVWIGDADILQELGIQGVAAALTTNQFVFQPGGENLTFEVVGDKITTHHFGRDNGVYLGPENPLGEQSRQVLNRHARPVLQVDPSGNETVLEWSGNGKNLQRVTDALSNTTQFSYDSSDRLTSSTDAEGRCTLYGYSPTSPRQPRLVVALEGTEIALNGDMEADTGWSNISGASPQVNQRSESHVDRANYSRYVSASAVNQGIEGNTWNLIANQPCTITVRVYVVAGQVRMQVPGVTAFDRASSGTGTWQTLTATHTPTSPQNNLRLQFVANQTNTRFYVDSVSIYQNTSGELVVNGDMEVDGNWTAITGQAPQTNVQSPLHADTGQYARYVEAASSGQGIESIAWNLEANLKYTILARVLVVNGAVKMQVPGVTAFDRTSSGTGTWQTFLVTHTPLSALTNRRLQFVATQANTQFYVDSVMVVPGAILQVQEFGYDGKGRVLAEKLLSAVDGTLLRETVRAYYTSGNGNGLLRSVRHRDLTNNNDLATTYFYDTFGRVIQTNQSSAFGNCTRSRTLYDAAGNVAASFCNFDLDTSGTPTASSGQASAAFDEDPTTYWQSTGLTNQWLQYDFGLGNAKALTSITLRARDTQLGEMPSAFTLVGSNDGGGWSSPILSVSGEPAWFSREAREYPFNNADAYRYWRLNIQAVSGGSQISLAELDLIPSTYPATVAEALALRASTANPDQNRLTIYEYDELGRRIRIRVNVGTSEEMTTLTVYDALNRVVRTVSNFVAATAPASPYTAAHSAFGHGTGSLANTQNLVTDTTYNARGLVENQTDVLGNVSRYVYDDAGRQVKVIQNYVSNGVDPALWVWNNNEWQNGSSVAISHGANQDQNIISASEYDANGNLIQTRDVLGKLNRTVYDVLNRVVKTVRNWQASGTGYNTDPVTWVWDSAQSRWEDAAGQPIPFGASNDQNLVAQTKYDHMGRVVRTQDETGEWTLFGYDPLGRQVRVIRNASNPDYDLVVDPDLNGYSLSSNADQDILTTTVYDVQGRVDYTVDVNGSQTKFVYDGLGRQVKVIQNYIAQGSSNPAAWLWDATDQRWERGASDNTAIVHGSNQDQNIITLTTYDTDGRVRWTQDVLGRKTWHVYDSVGREIKTIVNCTYNGMGTTPEDPAYAGSPDSDKDVITQMVYDAFGRVAATIDVRGNETRYFYNKLGRRTRTIANYIAQGATDPAAWLWNSSVNPPRWQNGSGGDISHGVNNDENLITEPTYDLVGRVISSRNQSGKVMQQVYDKANRRIRTVANYVTQVTPDPSLWLWDTVDQRWEDESGNAINHGTDFDLNLISETNYNATGQVIATRDARGTKTGFIYDGLGRRQQVVQAEGSPLASKAYTAYDKGGRVAWSVRNWQSAATTHNVDPLTWAWNGTLQRWEDNGIPVKSVQHGVLNDQNLPMAYMLDKLGRVVSVTNPVGSTTNTLYYKDGQVKSITDPLGHVTQHRYDSLRRLRCVVQAHLPHIVNGNEVDPSSWIWDAGQSRWEDGNNNPISHTNANDRNIIADVTLDVAGRQTAIRDPRGNQTTYAYDMLNRRTGLTNPLNNTWTTAYTDLSGGQSRVISTLPSPLSHQTEQNFDRLGRVIGINYLNESPKNTPDVAFGYDIAGNRTLMREFDGATTIRRTEYGYDAARRLSQVGFDTNGNGTVDQTVSYDYDRGGLRTQLTLPDGKTITYGYDQRGQLLSLTDWENRTTRYAHDVAGRLVAAEQTNGIRSRYHYDPASRLKQIRHSAKDKVFAHFEYELNALGNRTKAFETLAGVAQGNSQTIDYFDYMVDFYGETGGWTLIPGNWPENSSPQAAFRIYVLGKTLTLRMGVGPDYGICDIYVNNTLWGSLDNYYPNLLGVPTTITLPDEGPHLIDVRNRADRNKLSSGNKLSFVDLVTNRDFISRVVEYSYDSIDRITGAEHNYNIATSGVPAYWYSFSYDRAGNRTQKQSSVGGAAPVLTNYTYNAANQISQIGAQTVTYDNAGRLSVYTWDRAGRILNANGASYTYNGLGQRLSKIFGTDVTNYLLDVQPGLYKFLASTDPNGTSRYIHDPRGLLSEQRADTSWVYPMQDGLGTVRSMVSAALWPLYVADHFDPYGDGPVGQGSGAGFETLLGFTGEPRDFHNGLIHLRARDYYPARGVFPSLDPLEGSPLQPMSLNRYAYVQGNPVNMVDPLGLLRESPNQFSGCQGTSNQSCSGELLLNTDQFGVYGSWDSAPESGNWVKVLNSDGEGTLPASIIGGGGRAASCVPVFNPINFFPTTENDWTRIWRSRPIRVTYPSRAKQLNRLMLEFLDIHRNPNKPHFSFTPAELREDNSVYYWGKVDDVYNALSLLVDIDSPESTYPEISSRVPNVPTKPEQLRQNGMGPGDIGTVWGNYGDLAPFLQSQSLTARAIGWGAWGVALWSVISPFVSLDAFRRDIKSAYEGNYGNYDVLMMLEVQQRNGSANNEDFRAIVHSWQFGTVIDYVHGEPLYLFLPAHFPNFLTTVLTVGEAQAYFAVLGYTSKVDIHTDGYTLRPFG